MNKVSKKLSREQFGKAESFLKKYARKLDQACFDYHFNKISLQHVLAELTKYQNDDGGFGNGIEPDIRSKLSSPIFTTIAFQYLESLNINETPNFVSSALKYFDEMFKEDLYQWLPITKEINNSPNAPWWSFDEENIKRVMNLGEIPLLKY